MRNLASGQEQPRAPLCTGSDPAGGKLCRKRRGGPSVREVHRTAQDVRDLRRLVGLIFCGKESRWHYLAPCSFVSWKPPLHLGCWDQLQAPQCSRDMKWLEGIQLLKCEGILCLRNGWESWNCSAWRREGLAGFLSTSFNTWREGALWHHHWLCDKSSFFSPMASTQNRKNYLTCDGSFKGFIGCIYFHNTSLGLFPL